MMTRLPLAVPPSGPLYEGHFPGRPILPGVGLLDLSMRALAAEGVLQDLCEITSLRLRKLVAPGDLLELEVRTLEPDGSVRFDVRRSGEIVANAALVVGAPAVAFPLDRSGEPKGVAGAPGLDRLLPHRAPMLFVEGIDGEIDEGIVCSVRVPGRTAFAEHGSAPALLAVEMAAQSAAVFEGLRRSRREEEAGPRIGYLVGARDVKLARARLETDRTFTATVRQAGFAPPLSTYVFSVVQGREVVASGSLSAWLTATDV